MIYTFLANGFEEIEALAVVDILRRCGLQVTTVGVGGTQITGAHGITVTADVSEGDIGRPDDIDAVVLPGGMPGTTNLEKSQTVQDMLERAAVSGALVCAICAAPSVLGHKGLLQEKNAVCYPGFEDALEGAKVVWDAVVTDGNFITSKGPGVALEFGFAIAERLVGSEKTQAVRMSMQCKE